MSETEVEESGAARSSVRTFRIGVLCNGAPLVAWQVECLRHIQELGIAELVLFICNSRQREIRRSPWRRWREKLSSGLALWRAYERLLVDRGSEALKPRAMPAAFANVPRLEVEPIAIGKFRERLDDGALEEVKKHDLDVLVRFGFGILTGEILDVPKYGIWSFHHGDPEHFRGAPPGFWEIVQGAKVTGVILQRLTENLDGGVVLHRGWFKTNPANYVNSLDRILFGASHFLARALADLRRNGKELVERTPLQNLGPIYRYPRTRTMLTFFWRTAAAKVANQYAALFRHQQWNVGVVRKPAAAIFESLSEHDQKIEAVQWLPEFPGRFLADPFPVDLSGDAAIIAEEFDWRTGLGTIATIPCDFADHEAPHAAIQSDCHLSYPYTFEFEEETYCAPECAQSNSVLLYRLDREEKCWIEHKRIIDDFPAVDPTIFKHDDRWWLLCTSDATGPNEFLYGWFATEPTGKWTPHPLNPLKVDIRAARPAGRPFRSQDALIRPAQDCSSTYGGAISFNRIVKLSPEEFLEESVGQLLPDSRYPSGLHTISGWGEKTIVDGARLIFVPREFMRSALRKFGKVGGS